MYGPSKFAIVATGDQFLADGKFFSVGLFPTMKEKTITLRAQLTKVTKSLEEF